MGWERIRLVGDRRELGSYGAEENWARRGREMVGRWRKGGGGRGGGGYGRELGGDGTGLMEIGNMFKLYTVPARVTVVFTRRCAVRDSCVCVCVCVWGGGSVCVCLCFLQYRLID